MEQASKKNINVNRKKYSNVKTNYHRKYGTSQLERDFASEYLDKLGLKYIYQYEAKEIGRFYDFAIIYDEIVGSRLVRLEKNAVFLLARLAFSASIFLFEMTSSINLIVD